MYRMAARGGWFFVRGVLRRSEASMNGMKTPVLYSEIMFFREGGVH